MSNIKTITIVKSHEDDMDYYKSLIKELVGAGYEVNFVNIYWKNKSLDKTLDLLEKETFSEIVLGFSITAFFILFLKNKNVKKILACSPSPIWYEVFEFVPDSIKKILGKNRIFNIKNQFSERNMNSIKKIFIFGDGEIEQMKSGIARLKGEKYEISGSSHLLDDFIPMILERLK